MAAEGYNEGLFVDSAYNGDPNLSPESLFNDAPVGSTFINQTNGESWEKKRPPSDGWGRSGYISSKVTTTDATKTNILVVALEDDTVYLATCRVVARRTDAADRGVYIRHGAFYREGGGGVVQQGGIATPFTRKSVGSYNATMDVSGNNLILEVKGKAGHTVDWHGHTTLVSVN